MSKKAVAALLCLIIVAGAVFLFAGCEEEEQKSIVFLGDSIAEAVLGPSPLSAREDYGYYAIVGRRNGYLYYNRAVSGHKTSHMLEYISREDDSAYMTVSRIKEADVIHVSILGNDMLQTNVGELLLEMVKEEQGLIDGAPVREKILASSRENFAAIVAKLKEYNSDAVLMFQTVYNPVYPESTLVNASTREALALLGYTADDYRTLGGRLIEKLNGVIRDYLAENPDSFHIIDAYEAFGAISDADEERGRRLIYPDWIHPSNEGHAVMADLIQDKLEELLLTDKKTALDHYRQMRMSQIKREFPDADFLKAKGEFNSATSCSQITEAYFAITAGLTPTY